MPQVHNKARVLDQDSSAFSKNSRFMASLKFSEGSLRRMKAQNVLDQHTSRIEMRYFERHADIQQKKYERARQRIIEKAQKHIAYKLVLMQHSIAKAKDYKKALDVDYSYHALHYKVNNMLQRIQPDVVRERQARALINQNRKRYESLLRKNSETCAIIFPMKKTWEAFDFSKIKTKADSQDEDAKSTGGSVISPLPKIDPRKGQLRRRIIEEPTSKPSSSSKPISAKRQGITMNMMRKQKSFLENQEKVTQVIDPSAQESEIDNNPDAANNNESRLSGAIKETNDHKDKTDDDKTDENTLVLPPLELNPGGSKFMKRKGSGINTKLMNLSLNPKMSGVGMNPKIKLPALKMNKAPTVKGPALPASYRHSM